MLLRLSLLPRRALTRVCLTPLTSLTFTPTRSVTFALRPRLRRAQEDAGDVEKQEETRVDVTAMELISMVPPIEFEGRVAVCDGGSGPTGHPRVFINLDNGKPNPCGYCGIRFIQRHHDHSHDHSHSHHSNHESSSH